jgi:hypothetical protein
MMCGAKGMLPSVGRETQVAEGIEFWCDFSKVKCPSCGQDFMEGTEMEQFERELASQLDRLKREAAKALPSSFEIRLS